MCRIAFFIPTLHGGGAEKVVVNLIKEFSRRNLSIDLILVSSEGPYLSEIPKQVRIINLNSGRVLNSFFSLSSYLNKYKPLVLLSHMSHTNVVSVMAREFAGHKVPLILVEHDTLSAVKIRLLRARFVKPLMRFLYPRADFIIGVSKGTSRDLEASLGIPENRVKTIYNPIVDDELLAKATKEIDHSWFEDSTPPIFLAAGRLTEQKDFYTLIKAFSLVRQKIVAHLIILGEGHLRSDLEKLIKDLNLSNDVYLPGFANNPYAYMSKASVFVLSSRWEGLGNVLVEAMACGTPVVSTDCPNGPMEILDAGKYGPLVPVGDPYEMSKAMLKTLRKPIDKQKLQERSKDFSVEKSTSKYLALIDI